VQHRLVEETTQVCSLLQDGGHIYVCGDAHMAREVQGVLCSIVSKGMMISSDQAEETIRNMKTLAKYQVRDSPPFFNSYLDRISVTNIYQEDVW
jgi:sulfite reductase alpha subunit-like flavoprotein